MGTTEAIAAVIFDVDGVLFDSERLHVVAWERVFRREGVFLPAAEYDMGIGKADWQFLDELDRKSLLPSGLDRDRIYEEKCSVLIEVSDGKEALFPRVREILEDLSRRYILAAASNSPRRFLLHMIETAGILPFFRFILSKEDVRDPKPSPEIYLLCACRLGLLPHQCLVVEDSPVGVEAARAAGMKVIAVLHTTRRENLEGTDMVVETFGDLSVVFK